MKRTRYGSKYIIFIFVSPSNFQQINCVEIEAAQLTSSLATRLAAGLEALPHLEQVAIVEPTLVESLPHITSVRRLHLRNIPRDCEDWEWMKSVNDLVELEISIRTEHSDVTPEGPDSVLSNDDPESLHVLGNRVSLVNTSDQTACAFENLPLSMRAEVWIIKYVIYKVLKQSGNELPDTCQLRD